MIRRKFRPGSALLKALLNPATAVMAKPLYTAFSFPDFFKWLCYRIIIVAVLIYSLSHYEENPPVVVVFSILCVLAILLLGDDQISVYPDRIVRVSNSIISLVFRLKGKTYFICDIQSASLPTTIPMDTGDKGCALVLLSVLPSRRSRNDTNPIYLDLQDGRTVTILTGLESKKREKIVNLVNSLVKPETNRDNKTL